MDWMVCMSEVSSFYFYTTVFLFIIFLIGNKRNFVYEFISWVVIYFLFAYRYNVGTDFFTYSRIVTSIGKLSWGEIFSNFTIFDEIGYVIFAKITYTIGGTKLFFGLSGLITFVLIYFSLKKNFTKIDLITSLAVYIFYFYPTSFNLVRQFLAISIFFYSVRFILNRNIIKYLLTIIISASFHKSAFFLIPIYFLYDKNKKQINKWYYYFYVILIVIFLLNTDKIFLFFYKNNLLFKDYTYYLERNQLGKNRDLFFYLFLLFLILPFKRKLEKINSEVNFFYNLYIIGIILNILGFYNTYIKRISLYFFISLIVILGYIPKIISDKNLKLFTKNFIIFFMFLLFVLVYVILKHSEIFPYMFVNP